MKKLCVLLALVLALGCVPALAAQGDMILGRGEEESIYFSGCYAKGDTLYMPAYDSVYTWQVGQTELKSYSYDLKPLQKDNLGASMTMFACDGQLYGIALMSSYDEHTVFERAELYALTLEDGGTVSMEYLRELDWEDLVEYYDQDAYASAPENIVAMGNVAYMRYTNDQYDFVVGALDLETGRIEELDELADAFCIAPYGEGRLLVEQYNYNQNDVARLLVYDPESESVETLSELTIEPYSPLAGLAYDAATDTLYCVKGGEICVVDLEAGEVGEGVTDMPLEIYGNASACVLEGGYYALASEGLAIRNLDPGQKADIRFKVVDASYTNAVSKAYTDFANAHGDVSVVLSRDYSETENLIENMMNRDDRVDIYILATSNSIYEALYNRGYLMELDGNEKVKALADSLYPSIRERLSTNGHLVALPISTYSWAVGINEKALEKLGMKLADVPDDWSGFLDFLTSLQGKLNAETGIHLVYSGYTDVDLRYELLNMILTDFQYYVNASNPDQGYDAPLVHELLEKLEKIDFNALGVPSESDDDVFMLDAYDEESVLLQTSAGCSLGNFYPSYTPVLMRVVPDAPAYLVLDTTVMVVNPFTKNPEAALAFAGELVDNLSNQTRYCLCPELSEPIRGQQNQAVIDELKEELDALKADYDAADAEEKQGMEEDLREETEAYESAQANNWEVSPTELEWYRAHDGNIITSIYNWLYPDTTSDEDEDTIGQAAEAEDLMDQYLQGQINLNDMLAGIDRKVQMRRLEGN